MSTERSDKVYQCWSEATQKFDYFVTGLTGALTAYVGQNIVVTRIGFNPNTVELLALFCFIASVIAGFRRIESIILTLHMGHSRLYAEENKGAIINASQGGTNIINKATGDVISLSDVPSLVKVFTENAEKASDYSKQTAEAALKFYKLRNRLLFGGFALLVISWILKAYIR